VDATDGSDGLPIKPLIPGGKVLVLRVLAVLLILAAFVHALWSSARPTGEALGEASAPLIFGLIVAGLVSLAATRPKGPTVINTWLGLAAALSLLGVLRSAQEPHVHNAMNAPAVQAEIDAKLKTAFTSRAPSDGLTLMHEQVEALRWAEQRSAPASARFYRVARRVFEAELERAPELQRRLLPLQTLHLSTFPQRVLRSGSRDELVRAIGVLREAMRAVSDNAAAGTDDVSRAQASFERESADPGLARGFLRGRLERLGSDRRLADLLALRVQVLVALHDSWGSWTYSPATGEVSFSSSSAQAAFEAALARLRRALETGETGPIPAEGDGAATE
jgi:hypothetical protein